VSSVGQWSGEPDGPRGKKIRPMQHSLVFFSIFLLVFYLVSNFKYSVQIQILIFEFQIYECQNNIIPIVYYIINFFSLLFIYGGNNRVS
jgi:hypothetical protein